MRQEFLYSSKSGPVDFYFEAVKDHAGKDIGGQSGSKVEGESTIKDGETIKITSKLPLPLYINVRKYDGLPKQIDNWKNSMHFDFTYANAKWPEYQEQPLDGEEFQQSCTTDYSSLMHKGYRLAYKCKFSC